MEFGEQGKPEQERGQHDILPTLDRWVRERPLVAFAQGRVRRSITNAVTADVLYPSGSFGNPQKVENYRKHVDETLQKLLDKLNLSKDSKKTDIITRSDMQIDRYTGIKFLTEIRKAENAWISQETDSEGKIISQARIEDNDGSEMTLNYSYPRYENRGANPDINGASQFPTGAKVLFLNHAASLGIIDWKSLRF